MPVITTNKRLRICIEISLTEITIYQPITTMTLRYAIFHHPNVHTKLFLIHIHKFKLYCQSFLLSFFETTESIFSLVLDHQTKPIRLSVQHCSLIISMIWLVRIELQRRIAIKKICWEIKVDISKIFN